MSANMCSKAKIGIGVQPVLQQQQKTISRCLQRFGEVTSLSSLSVVLANHRPLCHGCSFTCMRSPLHFKESLFCLLNSNVLAASSSLLTLLLWACFSTSFRAPRSQGAICDGSWQSYSISFCSLPLTPAVAACKLCGNT